MFNLYISMFQWAEASSWHIITIFPKQPATRIKTHCVQKTNSSSHEALPSGQQGFAGQKACRTTSCLNQPQDIWPSSSFLDSCFRKWRVIFHFSPRIGFWSPLLLSNYFTLYNQMISSYCVIWCLKNLLPGIWHITFTYPPPPILTNVNKLVLLVY